MTTKIFRVYSKNQEDFVVIVNEVGGLSRYFNVSEFDMANILRDVGVYVDHEAAKTLTAFRKEYKKFAV